MRDKIDWKIKINYLNKRKWMVKRDIWTKTPKTKTLKYYMWVVSQHGPNRETLYNEIGHPSTYTWMLW